MTDGKLTLRQTRSIIAAHPAGTFGARCAWPSRPSDNLIHALTITEPITSPPDVPRMTLTLHPRLVVAAAVSAAWSYREENDSDGRDYQRQHSHCSGSQAMRTTPRFLVPVTLPARPGRYSPAPVAFPSAPVDARPAPSSHDPAPVDDKMVPVDHKPAPVAGKMVPVAGSLAPVDDKMAPVDGPRAPVDDRLAPVDDSRVSPTRAHLPVISRPTLFVRRRSPDRAGLFDRKVSSTDKNRGMVCGVGRPSHNPVCPGPFLAQTVRSTQT